MQPDTTDTHDTDENGPWSDGRYLVVIPSTLMPNRCIFCNTPTDGWKSIKLTVPLQRRVGHVLIGAAIVMLGRRYEFQYMDCGTHPTVITPRNIGVLAVLGWIVSGTAALFEFATDKSIFLWLPLALLSLSMVALFLYCLMNDVLVAKVSGNKMWLSGVSRRFLNDTPPLPKAETGYGRK